jgi:dTDP-4-dehydrorhamnose 3,5-epimerase
VSFAFTPTALPEVVLIDPPCFEDGRGFFMETWNAREFAGAGLDLRFAQEGHSRSARGVLRGLHYQGEPSPMGKLVRCTAGRIFDVAVDLRVGSPRFGRWFGIELSAVNRRLLYVPAGFAHGFQTLSEQAEVQYKMTSFYTPAAEGAVAWNDPELTIDWPLPDPILSTRDATAPSLRDYLAAPRFRTEDPIVRASGR